MLVVSFWGWGFDDEDEEDEEGKSRAAQGTLSAKVGLNEAAGLRSRFMRSFLRLAEVWRCG